jgi:hypothetical protein
LDVNGSARVSDLTVINPVYIRYSGSQTVNAYIYSNLTTSAASTANSNTFTSGQTYLLNFGTSTQEIYGWGTPTWISNVGLQVPNTGLYSISVTFGFINANSTFALDCFIQKNPVSGNAMQNANTTLSYSSCTAQGITLSTNAYLVANLDVLQFGFISYNSGTSLSAKTVLTITLVQKTTGLAIGSTSTANNPTTLSGYVGIGTTNPSYPLQVNGVANTIVQSIFAPNMTNGNYVMWLMGANTNENFGNGQLQFNYVSANNSANYIQLGVANQGTRLTITGNGYVGIGITNPSYPLHVVGSVNLGTNGNNGYLYPSTGGTQSVGTSYTNSVTAAFSTYISSWGVIAVSDIRIKNNIVKTDTSMILNKILQMPIMTYNYIDTVYYTNDIEHGVIAQTVKNIFPEAVNLEKGYIPSVYAIASSVTLSDDNNVIITITIPTTSELKVGGNVRMHIENIDKEYITTIVSFTTTQLVVPKWEEFDDTKKIFVYGAEVDDYHKIDKAYLALISMGGIQELSKLNDTLTNKVTDLQTQVTTLQTNNEILTSKVTNQQQTITEMQQQITLLMQQMSSLLQK